MTTGGVTGWAAIFTEGRAVRAPPVAAIFSEGPANLEGRGDFGGGVQFQRGTKIEAVSIEYILDITINLSNQ